MKKLTVIPLLKLPYWFDQTVKLCWWCLRLCSEMLALIRSDKNHDNRSSSRDLWKAGRQKGRNTQERRSRANPVPSPLQNKKLKFYYLFWPAMRAHPSWQRSTKHQHLFFHSALVYLWFHSHTDARITLNYHTCSWISD